MTAATDPPTRQERAAPASGRWKQRRVAAGAVKAVAVVGPALMSCATAFGVGRYLPVAPNLPLGLARFAVIIAASVVVMAVARVASRRLLPLSALLSLSLAFPDQTPKRLRVALRAPSARKLRRDLAGSIGTADGPVDAASQIVTLVAAISSHHRLTRGHSERVRAYADLIAREMGLDARDREMLTWAALLHDLGKITVPTAILDKPGKPDADEWRVLSQHPAASATIAEPLKDWMGDWWYGIGQHHEKWNGTGYPGGLRGSEISLAGRIVALADAFETMTAMRSYKRPVPIADARAELVRCAGSHFDPQVVRAFLNVGLGRLRTVVGLAAWLPLPVLNAIQPLRDAVTAGAGQVAGAVAVTAGMTMALPAVLASADSTTSPLASYGLGADAPVTAPTRAATSAATVVATLVEPAPAVLGDRGAPAAAPSVDAPGTDPVTGEPVATSAAPDASAGGEPNPTTATSVSESDPATTATATTAHHGDGDGTTAAHRPTTATTAPATTAPPVATPPPATTAPPTPPPASTAPPTTAAPVSLRVVDDAFTVTAGRTTNVNVLANDAGIDRSTLSVSFLASDVVTTRNGNGTIAVTPLGTLASATRTFTYRVCTVGRTECATARVTLTIVS